MRRLRILVVTAVASVGLLVSACSSPTGPAQPPSGCDTIPWTC